MQLIETVREQGIERILLFCLFITMGIIAVWSMKSFKKIKKDIDKKIEKIKDDLSGDDKLKLAREDKIKDLLNAQLYSTYEDAPIDEENWKRKSSLRRLGRRFLSVFGGYRGDFAHDDITIKVFRRLFLRHSLLNAVEKMASCHSVNGNGQQLENGVLSKEALQSFSANKYAGVFASSASQIGGGACGYSPDEFNLLLLGKNPEKLNILTQNTTHEVNSTIGESTSESDCKNQPFLLLPNKLRAYNLAVTDLFVEKALAYLNRKARTYNRWAKSFIAIALSAISMGAFVAFVNTVDWNDRSHPIVGIASWVGNKFSSGTDNESTPLFLSLPSFSGNLGDNTTYMPQVTFLKNQTYVDYDNNKLGKIRSGIVKETQAVKQVMSALSSRNISTISENDIDVYRKALEEFVKTNPQADKKEIAASLFNLIGSDRNTQHWTKFISSFVKGFTFYGLLVLLAVFCYRMSRALFDQAERLKDRRHALRQGRLFVHLNGGKMSVDEMEKAFNWNMSSENAFANINPDAQAPWGNVVKEMLKTIRETSKAGIKAAERK